MVVRPLRDDRYVVETNGGTYVVDVETASCSCPDSEIRGSRCKHLRRVAIEISAGLIPAPGEREAVCAVCGLRTFVPATASGTLCARHDHVPGDLVRDRETGKRLVVVRRTEARADGYRTPEGRTIASYETNADYGDHEPVVEAVYLDSLGAVRDLTLGDVAAARHYGFPASRLQHVAPDYLTSGVTRGAGVESAPGTSA